MKIVATSLAHDSSACFLEDGEIKYWNKQERLSRVKRAKVPFAPLLEIERHFDLSDLDFYVSASPFQQLSDEDVFYADAFNLQCVSVPFYNYFKSVHPHCEQRSLDSHHLTHAANAFYNSGFDAAYVLVIDRNGSILADRPLQAAVGVETETLYFCEYPCRFEIVYSNPAHWVGITGVYSLMSEALGIGEMENGKTMALAAYGGDAPPVELFDGYVPKSKSVRMPVTNGLFLARLLTEQEFRGRLFYDVCPTAMTSEQKAYRVQKCTTEAVLELIEDKVDFGKCENLCFTGGHAHNCLLNAEIVRTFDRIQFYPDPIPDDSGTSIGAAKYWWYHQTQSCEKFPLENIYNCGLPM